MIFANVSAEWLTSFWLISIGVALGLVMLAISLGLFKFLGQMGLTRFLESGPQARWVVGGIASAVSLVVGLVIWLLSQPAAMAPAQQPSEDSWLLALLLLLPFSLFFGFGVMGMCTRRAQQQMFEWLGEGISFWLLVLGLVLSAFAVFGVVGQHMPMIRFVSQPTAMLNSVWRLPYTGVQSERRIELNPSLEGDEGTAIPVNIFGVEVKRITLQSNERLEFSTDPITPESDRERVLELAASSDPTTFTGADTEGKIPRGLIENLYVRNLSDRETVLSLVVETQPQFPQVSAVFVTMFLTWGCFLVILFQAVLLPKEAAISWSTFKTETSQPLFGILLAVGLVFLTIALYIPYNTFGEDIKMYVTTGRPVILLLCIFFAVWASSKSVAEEIEGRTALTVLAKPISRRQFLVGKTMGVGWAVGLLFLCFGLWFLFLISYKTIYDGVESSKGTLPWQDGFGEMVKVVPALALGYMETMVFVFISVMISTRLAVVSNLMICFSIYMLGHITPMMLEKEDTFESVNVVGQAITTIIPVLEHFDVSAAIVGDATVPMTYLGWTLVYTTLYCGVALLVALILFEDRDLS